MARRRLADPAEAQHGEIVVRRRADELGAGTISPEVSRIAIGPRVLTTWLLVTTWPAASQTKPVPVCRPPRLLSLEEGLAALRGLREDMDHGGRHALEELDGRPLDRGEVAARA